MQTIAVLAVLAAVMCIARESPGDVFPHKAVWESIDLHEVLIGLSNEAKQAFSTIHSNAKATLAETRRAEKERAKKFGVENQWNDFIKKEKSKTAEMLRKLPELYEQYRTTWKGDESRENIEKNQKELRDKHKKEFFILVKELLERFEHKFRFN